jgi:hypothetical protein
LTTSLDENWRADLFFQPLSRETPLHVPDQIEIGMKLANSRQNKSGNVRITEAIHAYYQSRSTQSQAVLL